MTQGINLPFPEGPQRRVYLPNMSAGDVCRRMLGNLCRLQQMRLRRRTQDGPAASSSDGDLSSTWLVAPLVQLASRFSLEVFSEVAANLLDEQQCLGSGMAAVYTKLWPETVYMVGGLILQCELAQVLAQGLNSSEPSLSVWIPNPAVCFPVVCLVHWVIDLQCGQWAASITRTKVIASARPQHNTRLYITISPVSACHTAPAANLGCCVCCVRRVLWCTLSGR